MPIISAVNCDSVYLFFFILPCWLLLRLAFLADVGNSTDANLSW
jgi:hypothetical protein